MSKFKTPCAFLAVLTIFLFIPAAAARAQDLSLEERFHISGYGNVHVMDHNGIPRFVGEEDLDDAFFQLREFSLFMDFVITDYMLASIELEVGDNASEINSNYAYLDFQVVDEFSFRVGQMLVPFLSYNENKPNFKQYLMSPPLIAQNLIPVIPHPPDFHGLGWTDVGLSVNYSHEFEGAGILDFKAMIMNGFGSLAADTTGPLTGHVLDSNVVHLNAGPTTHPNVRTRNGLTENEGNLFIQDNNNDFASTAKLTFLITELPDEIQSLDVGFSWYRGKWDPDSEKDLNIWGFHLNLIGENEDWVIKSEYARARVEQDAGLDVVAAPHAGANPPVNLSSGDYDMHSFYIEVSGIPFRWEGWFDDEQFLRLIVRYDDLDTNTKVPFTPFDRNRWTGGTEWQFSPNARFRAEFQHTTIHNFGRAPAPFLLAGGEETITMLMLSVIFWF